MQPLGGFLRKGQQILLRPSSARLSGIRDRCGPLRESNWERRPAGGPPGWQTVPDVRIHDLRHAAASLWLAAGAEPKVVQRVLGHATAAMTMDLYGHLLDASLWQAARLIGGTTGASERLQERIRMESEPGQMRKTLRSWAFVVEPRWGIEPECDHLNWPLFGLLSSRMSAPPGW
jgi:hypothetical protein